MKKTFEEPVVNDVTLNVKDVITTSEQIISPTPGPNDGPIL